MKFLENSKRFAKAFESAANYPNGHIFKKDGSPAVFLLQNNIDLGLQECRRAIYNEANSGSGHQASVYTDNGDTGHINYNSRSTLMVRSRSEHMRAAYNALDINFRDKILPNIKCSFDFNSDFEILSRQQLVYQTNDHFVNQKDTTLGHSDDSILIDEGWVRNDIKRHLVGLFYLTDNVDNEAAVKDETTQFSGGHLDMPFITTDGKNPMSIKPKYGTLLFFPASPLYIHSVSNVTKGTRIVVTTWYTLPQYA